MIAPTVSLKSVIILRTKVKKELKKMEVDKSPIIDYGDSNGWKITPCLIQECNHTKKEEKLGKCYHRYTCEKCGFTYKVDSGG